MSGTELFLGAKYEPKCGHVVVCGLGGIFVEVLEDVSSGLAPPDLCRRLFHDPLPEELQDHRRCPGKEGINGRKFAEIIVDLSTLLRFATEIKELDRNPLLGTPTTVTAVDARFRVE